MLFPQEQSSSFQRLTSTQGVILLLGMMIVFTLFISNSKPTDPTIYTEEPIDPKYSYKPCPICEECPKCPPEIYDPPPAPICNLPSTSITAYSELMKVCEDPETLPTTTLNLRQIDPDLYAPIAKDEKVVSVLPQYGGYKICIWPAKDDKFVSAQLESSGHWDPSLSNIMAGLFSINKDKIFVDVGANLGYFSLMAASYGHKTYSFEAVGNNMAHFAKSIKENGFEDKIKAFNNAISDTNVWMEITEDATNKGGSGFRKHRGSEFANVGTTQVPSVTIDQVVGHMDVFILKIDIEGMEARAFNGAKKLISQKIPPFIFVELNPGDNRKNGCEMNKVVQELVKLGYSIYDQTQMPGVGVDYSNKPVDSIPMDVVFMHKSATQYLPL